MANDQSTTAETPDSESLESSESALEILRDKARKAAEPEDVDSLEEIIVRFNKDQLRSEKRRRFIVAQAKARRQIAERPQ